ncbi:hypothetical protein WMZ97_16580 [Lentibacillus sp. N15]|uniref:hypothetical protein n=1 Tax=Lentibacillus songyuanensis TaxID=3136161 RepID=UPI0031B9DB91
MWEKADELKEMLKQLELFKQEIMKEINRLGENEKTITRTTVYPMAKVKPLIIKDYPVFQFGYEGMLPTYKENDQEYLSILRHYYYRATFDSYDYSQMKLPVMNEAVIVYVHYFRNKIIRDLDNRNKKFIQDAIRQTRIIGDDHWRNVWNMDIGFLDEEKYHLQVYVVPRNNFIDFIDFLLCHHENLKHNTDYLLSKSEYKAHYFKEKEKELTLDESAKKTFHFFS